MGIEQIGEMIGRAKEAISNSVLNPNKAPRHGGASITRRDFIKYSAAIGGTVLVGGEVVPAYAETSQEAAAKRFGASAYTRNATNWLFTSMADNQVLAYGLNPDGTGQHHRINLSGLPVEAYVDIKQKAGAVPFFQDERRAVAYVVNGAAVPSLDVRGGTLWDIRWGEDISLSLKRLWGQVVVREEREQPGALLIPVGWSPECPTASIDIVPVTTAQTAAARFGGDDYSRDQGNWLKTYDDEFVSGFKINPNPTGDHTRLNNLQGVFYEGYLDHKDDGEVPFFQEGRRAVGIVGNGLIVPSVDLRGGTVWVVKQRMTSDQLMGLTKVLYSKLVTNELTAQPGAIMLPYGFNPGSSAC